jgi:branched-chain amino acid transport system substrate-binding protein
MSIQIGLLLPRSAMYPTISFDLMAGLRKGLEHLGIEKPEIKTENIGVGGDEKFIYAQCERMLFDGIRAIAAYINPRTAEKLQPLFSAAGAILIVLDAGYQYHTPATSMSHVFFLSLQGTLCCRTITQIAGREGKTEMAYVSSYYDAGYRTAYSFSRSLEEVNGRVTYNHITKLKRAEFTLAGLEEHLHRSADDGILASFCGDMLYDFCNEASKTGLLKDRQVYASPFMAEEYWLGKTPYPGVDFKTCVPWASTLNNYANKEFVEALQQNKQNANVFSLLGWEAAAMIAVFAGSEDTDAGIERLESFTFESPRGTIMMDPETHFAHAPVYEAVISKDESTGNCLLVPGDAVAFIGEQRMKAAEDMRSFEGQGSSWLNTYPCIES